jgi:hypothetical protein
MAIPHYNYFPPAGSVIDLNDRRVTWDGSAWRRKNHVYRVPSKHRLVGVDGGPLSGWYYDWKQRAWIEPGNPQPPVVARPPAPVVVVRPQPVDKEKTMSCNKPNNALETLRRHPWAPLIGLGLKFLPEFAAEPMPPAIPDGTPETQQKQIQMTYDQNLLRFQRRMSLYDKLGDVLLGYASVSAVMESLPSKRSA